jgi:hypothetical protein
VSTFLLTWNASETGYATHAADVAATAAGHTVQGRWTFGSRRGGAAAGDRVFLLRQRADRGIVAAGTLVDGLIFPAAHWAGDPRRVTYYAEIRWDTVLPVADRLPVEDLLHDVPGHHWNAVFASGQRIRPPADAALEKRWAEHLGLIPRPGR